jgi:hypothetical protein
MDAPALLHPGLSVTVYLVGNRVHRGRIAAVDQGWLVLEGEHPRLINLAQVVEVLLDDADPGEAALPRPRSKETPVKAGPKAPARPWSDDELKSLAQGFLDGATDTELAERFHRTRTQITIMHQGFECARGNITDDTIAPVARTWVERWRKALAG